MINKNKFSIKNTKKVLHKVGKQWVVVSAVLLGLVAGGAAVTNANADQTAQAAQPTTQISPADKAKAQNAIADLKAHKGDIVNKSINEVHSHITTTSASSAYQGLASMAKTSNLDQFSSAVSLGNTSSANMNTWMGEFNTAKSYANAINSPRLNSALNKVNGYLNTNISDKVKNIPVNQTLPASALSSISAVHKAQVAISNISNLLPSEITFVKTPNITFNVHVTGQANVDTSLNEIINSKELPLTFNNGYAHINASVSDVTVKPTTDTVNKLSQIKAFFGQKKYNYYEARLNSKVSYLNNELPNIIKSNIESHSQPLTSLTLRIPNNYSIPDIINLLDAKQGFANDSNGKVSSAAHMALESAATNELGNSAKASNGLDKVADVLRAGDQMLANSNMSSDYNNLVDALATLPNDKSDNASDKSSFAGQLMRAASNANALASAYSNASASSDNSADSSDTIRFLSDAARQAGSVATSLMAGSSVTPASNSSSASSASSKPSSNNSNSSNSVEPNDNNNASTNTNNSTYVPYIAPNSFASSVAAQMNGNSASAKSNASTSASANANTSVAPENEKHAANYAKVIKSLQLHTSPNFSKRNAVAVVKPGFAFWIEKSVKANNGALRYEVKYNKKNYFITANKHMVDAYYKAAKHNNYSVKNYVHYRYAKVIKSLQLHTNAKFTKRNGVKVVKPNTEFHINNIVKNHGLVRYEVRYQGHNYFITANHHYTVNAYVQKYNFRKHGYKGVRVIKPINEYRKLSFAKRSLIRHFYRGSVLPVKKVVTIASGEMTRLQLTNGHYVTANKDFVEPIR